MLVSACRRSLLVSACPLLSVSRSASIEAACQSQRVVRTAFRAVSCVAHLLRNVCLSVFASQRVSVCLLATRVDLSYFASQRASVCLPASGVNYARRERNRYVRRAFASQCVCLLLLRNACLSVCLRIGSTRRILLRNVRLYV